MNTPKRTFKTRLQHKISINTPFFVWSPSTNMTSAASSSNLWLAGQLKSWIKLYLNFLLKNKRHFPPSLTVLLFSVRFQCRKKALLPNRMTAPVAKSSAGQRLLPKDQIERLPVGLNFLDSPTQARAGKRNLVVVGKERIDPEKHLPDDFF